MAATERQPEAIRRFEIRTDHGKIIITSCAYDDRVGFLQERGVDVIIDTAPKVLERLERSENILTINSKSYN